MKTPTAKNRGGRRQTRNSKNIRVDLRQSRVDEPPKNGSSHKINSTRCDGSPKSLPVVRRVFRPSCTSQAGVIRINHEDFLIHNPAGIRCDAAARPGQAELRLALNPRYMRKLNRHPRGPSIYACRRRAIDGARLPRLEPSAKRGPRRQPVRGRIGAVAQQSSRFTVDYASGRSMTKRLIEFRDRFCIRPGLLDISEQPGLSLHN